MIKKIFANTYDLGMKRKEREFLSGWRVKLLSNLRGSILEIGSGTGVNFSYYNGGTMVDALDTSGHMCSIARSKILNNDIVVIESSLKNAARNKLLRFKKYDNIVFTLVLCSISDYELFIIDIINNYLSDGGTISVIEHIESKNSFFKLIQTILNPLQNIIADGCNLKHSPNKYFKKLGITCEYEEFYGTFKNFYCAKYIKNT